MTNLAAGAICPLPGDHELPHDWESVRSVRLFVCLADRQGLDVADLMRLDEQLATISPLPASTVEAVDRQYLTVVFGAIVAALVLVSILDVQIAGNWWVTAAVIITPTVIAQAIIRITNRRRDH